MTTTKMMINDHDDGYNRDHESSNSDDFDNDCNRFQMF